MRALVLSGGGAKGAYEAGVVLRALGDNARCYDVFCGTSVGAINAAHLAQFKTGDEKLAANGLATVWRSIQTNTVYKEWSPLGMLAALFKPSVYSTAPLREFLHARLDGGRVAASGKALRVSAVSLKSGARRVWTERSGSTLCEGVLASSAMPVFFEPVKIDGEVFVDGGIRETTPLQDAIDAGADEIDVVVVDQTYLEGTFPASFTVIDVAKRTLGAMLIEIEQADLEGAELVNRLIDAGHGAGKRKLAVRVIRPAIPLGDSLDFSPQKIARELRQGYDEAVKAGW